MKIKNMLILAIISIVLSLSIAHAQAEKIAFTIDDKIYDQDDGVIITAKNIGTEPIYILDSVVINGLDNNLTVEIKNSSAILRLYPGKSYTWQWVSADENISGIFKTKIYWTADIGNKTLIAMSTGYIKKERSTAPKIHTNKRIYKYGNRVKLTIKNHGDKPVYIPENWSLINAVTREAINISVTKRLVKDDEKKKVVDSDDTKTSDVRDKSNRVETATYYRLNGDESLSIIWNQKDEKGKHVEPGKYIISAAYSFDQKNMSKLNTREFTILAPRPDEREK